MEILKENVIDDKDGNKSKKIQINPNASVDRTAIKDTEVSTGSVFLTKLPKINETSKKNDELENFSIERGFIRY